MYSAIAANKRKSFLIMLIFVVIIFGLGLVVGTMYNDINLLWWIVAGSILYATFEYFAASKLALVVNGAKRIEKRDNPRLFRAVENLCITTGLLMPEVYIIDDLGLNAFATGRDPAHASVAVTSGLLDMLSDTELEAVMAHELGHIRNYDIRVSMIVFGLVSAIGIIADLLLHMGFWGDDDDRPSVFAALAIAAGFLAPFVALLVQLAVSRQREYLADSTGVLTTRYPDGLISALEKIRDHGSTMKRQNTSTAHLFFANPLKGKGEVVAKFLSTHPPIDDRIARLRALGDKL